MADPEKKAITAPAGTNFQLRWTLPHNVGTTISFIDANGSQDFPDKKCKAMNGFPPTDKPLGTATVKISVKKGPTAAALQPDVFKKGRAPPTMFVKWSDSTNLFAAAFAAADEGIYEFTTVIERTQPGKTIEPKTMIETVTCTPGDDVSPKRQAMLDLFDKWLPTSILGQVFPKKFGDPAKQQDILELSGWSTTSPTWNFTEHKYDGKTTAEHSGTGQGNESAEQRKCNDARTADYNTALAKWKADGSSGTAPAKPVNEFDIVTSCGSVMSKFLQMWGCDFDGDGKLATRDMSIADDYTPKGSKTVAQYGAKHYGYWVDAKDVAFKKLSTDGADWKPKFPKAGDIIVLWDDVRNIRAHVCMTVSASEDTWTTAEGGGGTIPDQTASKNNKDVTWKLVDADHPKGIPHILDVTSGKTERVTGWVDLELIPNPKFPPPKKP